MEEQKYYNFRGEEVNPEEDEKTIDEILSFFRKMACGETVVMEMGDAARWHDWLIDKWGEREGFQKNLLGMYTDKIYPTTDGKGDTTGYCLDGAGEFYVCDDAVANGLVEVGDDVEVYIFKTKK